MCRFTRRLCSAVVLCMLGVTTLRAQTPPTAATTVPRVIRVNGALRLASGSPAPVEIVTFAIYADETGGEPVWQETQNLAVGGDGRYSALLGATLPDGLPLDVFTSQDKRWLEVHVERSGEPTSPRVLLASVPFALRASDAETLGGKPPSAFLLAEPVFSGQPSGARSKTSTKSGRPLTTFNANQGFIPVAVDNAGALGNSVMFQGFPAGSSIGLGTTTPRDYFHVSFDDPFGAFTGFAVQNRNGSPNASSGMLFYDQNGALAMFQGFNNAGHEYRMNNIAPGGAINFITGGTSRFLVASSGNIGIGVASPASKLDVAGDVNVSVGLRVRGSRVLHVPTGFESFGVGVGAMNPDTTGQGNTGVGAGALGNATSGSFNTAVGSRAMSANMQGPENTAIGYNALGSMDLGIQNVAAGNQAMSQTTTGSFNVAIGDRAMFDNTTGSSNVAIGKNALVLNNSGGGNIAIGFNALSQLRFGELNVALGPNAGSEIRDADSNNVDIAHTGVAGDTGVVRIGTPGRHTSFFAAGIRGVTTGVADAVSVIIDSAGQLGTINSSRRYKEDIQDMGEVSSGLMKLRPVTFRYSQPYADGGKPIDYGLIAEEVEAVYPDLVAHLADGQVETVQYHKINAMLLNEVQKQDRAVQALQDQVAAQRAEIELLKVRLDELAHQRTLRP